MDRAQPDAGVIEILGAELVQARAVEDSAEIKVVRPGRLGMSAFISGHSVMSAACPLYSQYRAN